MKKFYFVTIVIHNKENMKLSLSLKFFILILQSIQTIFINKPMLNKSTNIYLHNTEYSGTRVCTHYNLITQPWINLYTTTMWPNLLYKPVLFAIQLVARTQWESRPMDFRIHETVRICTRKILRYISLLPKMKRSGEKRKQFELLHKNVFIYHLSRNWQL